jgi:8-oxo-dGTP pyrophosphatase MutT (NUDIX family)
VRVAILDPEAWIFLLRYNNEEVGVHWAMPGGGIDPGETLIDAARREVAEETGWHDVEIGDELWTWEHDFTREGIPVRQSERILLGHSPRRDPTGDLTFAHAADGILAWRWWSPSEVTMADEPLWPPNLAALLAQL